jgi:YgiT-type zinc finger domain-containing protein
MSYANCSICGGKVVERHVQTEFWWGDDLMIFENVPAGVCENCGEQYFKGEIYDKITRMAEEKTNVKREIKVPVKEFVS